MEESDNLTQPQPTWEEYTIWLSDRSSKIQVERARTRAESVAARVRDHVEESDFWQSLKASLENVNDEYTSRYKYKLFISTQAPQILVKSYDSILNKSYRKNVLTNRAWPNPPGGEWITPVNWYERLNDIVRTSFVVKYLDGVDFFVRHLQEVADRCGYYFTADYEAREEGYYAAHCYVAFPIGIPTIDWNVETVNIRLEIQVTTQLQEVIKNLTHGYYESRRSRETVPDVKWQWDYKCPEFVPNYLGHILHYVEGMIMEVRNRGEA